MNKRGSNYIVIILILVIIILLFLFTINLPKIFDIKKNDTNESLSKEYVISLKDKEILLQGIVDIYLYNKSEVIYSDGRKEVVEDYRLLESLVINNKSYSSKMLNMNHTYCFKGRSNGYYSTKFCKFLDITPVSEKIDINLNKASNISIYSDEVIADGERSLVFNIISKDDLEYRDIVVCLDWSKNIIYSRLEYGELEINRINYYKHCYELDKSLDNDNKVIAKRLYYKTNKLYSEDYIEIAVFDKDESIDKYFDEKLISYQKTDLGGYSKYYFFTKNGNYERK